MTSSKIEIPGEMKSDPAALMASLQLMPSPVPDPEIKYTKVGSSAPGLRFEVSARVLRLALAGSKLLLSAGFGARSSLGAGGENKTTSLNFFKGKLAIVRSEVADEGLLRPRAPCV